MKNFKLLFGFIAVLAVAGTLFAFTTSKNVKQDVKPQTIVTFYYTAANESTINLADDANYTTTAPSFTSGRNHLYSITFDDATYPLAAGKPNFTVLNTVSTSWTSGSLSGAFGTSGITYVNKQ